jgi:hypothetical protein
MDIIKTLFNFIPESVRPYAAFALLVLYVVTKARSVAKSDQIKKLVVVVSPKPKEGERSLFPEPSRWQKFVDAIF